MTFQCHIAISLCLAFVAITPTNGGGINDDDDADSSQRVRGGSIYYQELLPGAKKSLNDDKAWILPLYKSRAPGSKSKRFDCAANLIAPRYLITAAHCACKSGSQLSEYSIGYPDKTGKRERTKHVELSDIICHPTWLRGQDPKVDLAILELKVPFKKSEVQPIQVAKDELVTPEMKLSILGWGYYNKQGRHNSRLLVANITLTDAHVCHQAFQPRKIENIFCSAYKEKLGTCPGDSGGPLVADYDGLSKDLLFGIVRSGGSYADCGTAESKSDKKPATFTDLREYTDWIFANIGDAETKTNNNEVDNNDADAQEEAET